MVCCDEAHGQSWLICSRVNTAPEKHRNVSAVGAGVRGQLKAKAGGIHQSGG